MYLIINNIIYLVYTEILSYIIKVIIIKMKNKNSNNIKYNLYFMIFSNKFK